MSIRVATDEFTNNELEMCNYCKGKSICQTNCCKKKLCHFHLEDLLFDNSIMECQFCIETKNYVLNNQSVQERFGGYIFCNDHLKDELKYCYDCEFYYCNKHFEERKYLEELMTKCGHGYFFLDHKTRL